MAYANFDEATCMFNVIQKNNVETANKKLTKKLQTYI